jgi:hypothetical protein
LKSGPLMIHESTRSRAARRAAGCGVTKTTTISMGTLFFTDDDGSVWGESLR